MHKATVYKAYVRLTIGLKSLIYLFIYYFYLKFTHFLYSSEQLILHRVSKKFAFAWPLPLSSLIKYRITCDPRYE